MRNKSNGDIKIGFILDEFSRLCFEGIGDNVYLSFEKWKDEISENNVEIVFIESAWRGNNGKWFGKLTNVNRNSQISKLIDYCKESGIPTVFWNKEDPVHFKAFLGLAKMVDYVYTTDRDSISKYKKYIKHDRIGHLHFACEPRVHNPIMFNYKRKNKLCFAGSYYTCKYDERKADFDRIMKLSLVYGVDIYDRNMGNKNVRYRFPNRYKKNIVGILKGKEILQAYKGYRVMINVNSVKLSSTMFSRRVFECLACGTPIISSYSLGINNYFGELICSSDDYFKCKREIERLMEDESFYQRKSKLAVRAVMEEHTVESRLNQVLNDLEIEYTQYIPDVLVISVINSIEEYERILKFYLNQSYKFVNLLVIVRGNTKIGEYLQDKRERISTLFYKDKKDLEKVKREIKSQYVAVLSPKNYYGDNYLKDLILCRKYSEAKIIGKGCYLVEEDKDIFLREEEMENRYVEDMELDSCIIESDLFLKEFLNEDLVDTRLYDSHYRSVEKDNVFSSDRFNLIKNVSFSTSVEELGEYLV